MYFIVANITDRYQILRRIFSAMNMLFQVVQLKMVARVGRVGHTMMPFTLCAAVMVSG